MNEDCTAVIVAAVELQHKKYIKEFEPKPKCSAGWFIDVDPIFDT